MAAISLAFHALQDSRVKYKLEFVIVGAATCQHCIMETISLAFHALQASRVKYKLEFVIVGAALHFTC